MKNLLLTAAAFGGGRELQGTLAIFAVVTLSGQLFFYVLRITAIALGWIARTPFAGVRNASRRRAIAALTVQAPWICLLYRWSKSDAVSG